ncbi:DMT family transporter [Salidesulfovibrio onnuriiensis]|uniref:DMT family transporter n=1 Tax=Salidesulfovibrio onnuriiensis TaxID=2583823 RepID=UPI00202B5B7F|nr:DMT family transporter [Salidesulfovibrio onnuriiensis]
MSKAIAMTKKHETEVLPTLAILGAVLLWGSSFPAMKAVLAYLEPWTVMWLRLIFGSLALLPMLGRVLPRKTTRANWKLLAPLALLQPCLYFLLESYALKYTTSAQAGIIAATLPIMVAVGARVFLAETTTLRAYAGLLLSVGGVAWLTLAGSPSANAPNPALGNLLEFGAMVCAAGYMLLVKRLSDTFGPWTLTAIQTFIGAVFFLPGLWPLVTNMPEGLGTVLPVVVYLGTFVTLGAFGLYNIGIARIPASRASAFINLVPVVAVAVAWVFLGETLSPTQMLAAALIFLGVWVTQKSGNRG